MSGKRLFCFGYGYTAAALSRILRADGWEIAGTATSEQKMRTMKNDGVDACLWGEEFDAKCLDGATAILISTPPGEKGCPSFRVASEAITQLRENLQWIAYLSTNGVYGDHKGEWVDENSDLFPTSDRSRHRIAAEAEWAGLCVAWSLPLIIFRLPGIYGPGRSALDTVRSGGARRIVKEGQVFNRMHVDDIAAALAASINNPRAHDLYNLADDEPAPPQDVVEYACKLLDVDPPPLTPIENADLSEMAKSFYRDNKRVSNARAKEALGLTLKHPTYREGLSALLNGSN